MANITSGSTGIGLTGATFIVFLVLKLTNVIDWSWWWVFSPLLISAGVILLVLATLLFLSWLSND